MYEFGDVYDKWETGLQFDTCTTSEFAYLNKWLTIITLRDYNVPVDTTDDNNIYKSWNHGMISRWKQISYLIHFQQKNINFFQHFFTLNFLNVLLLSLNVIKR